MHLICDVEKDLRQDFDMPLHITLIEMNDGTVLMNDRNMSYECQFYFIHEQLTYAKVQNNTDDINQHSHAFSCVLHVFKFIYIYFKDI